MTTNESTKLEMDEISSAEKNKVAPYLEEFLESYPEEKVIFWDGTPENYTMLNSAIRTPNMDQLKGMLLGGAPYNYESVVNESYNYGTLQAAFYSRADIIRITIVRHRHENVDNGMYEILLASALKTVCRSNCSDIARILLDAGSHIYQNHVNIAADSGSWPVIAEFVEDFPDIDLNHKNTEDYTPLHSAILKGHKHTVQYLLDKNADPNIPTSKGQNAGHLACSTGNVEILQLVTQYGVDVRARDLEGKTAALIAAEGGKDECFAILARKGANLDQRDNYGNIPMTVAAGLGHANTIKELLKNGASFRGNNSLRYSAVEMACLNKKDNTAAVIIQLEPAVDYLRFYLQTCWITWMKLVRDRMTESIRALLDRMVVPPNDAKDSCLGVVNTKYLYLNPDKKTPDQDDYEENSSYFLKRIAALEDEDIAYHGTIRILVDKKMQRVGNAVLGMKMVSFVLFLFALAYSLIQASYEPIPREAYTNDFLNAFRIITDLFVLAYFIFNCITEFMEFFRVIILTKQDIKSDKNERDREKELVNSVKDELHESKEEKSKFGDENKESSFLFIRVTKNYFSDKSNYFDVFGLGTLFILFILRATAQPVQWVFATITFFINALRIFKLVVLIPFLGPYSTIIYKILIYDVPLFSSLFGLTLLIFTGGYFIALRTPYSAMGFSNASLLQDTMRTPGVDNEVQWVFLSGLRVLLEGNIYSDEYLYRNLNWLAACIYLSFLFLTVVVFLNVFIAQLSDTYGTIKRNAERTYAWQKLNFLVQIETTSLLSFCLRRKKQSYIKEQKLTKETLLKYYGVTTLKQLSHNYCPKEIDVNETLSSHSKQLMAIEDKLQLIGKLLK